jgi:transglutaminase-like putative cysteine protease
MSLSTHQLLYALPSSVPFVDHTEIEWPQVRRTHSWIYQRYSYEYPGPVKDMHQRLIVVPPARHGSQMLVDHKLRVSSPEAEIRSEIDGFGNRVYYLDLAYVAGSVQFELWSSVKWQNNPALLPMLTPAEAAVYYEPSRLTLPDRRLEVVSRRLAAAETDPARLAELISQWVWQNMRYVSGVTTVSTGAAEALNLGQGLCQDYSHIMLSLCRLAGLPARYVSGHLLGEGGSHAWVEVLLPSAAQPAKLEAVAFDPTNHGRSGLRYITVAVGRDYQDASPTTGYYTGPYSGRLHSSKRAGLILVEYFDGRQEIIDESEIVPMEDADRRSA